MKKLVCSFALVLSLGSAASAQVAFGLKAGPMLARTHASLGDSVSRFTDAKASFVAGAFLRVPLFAKASLQAELLYAKKGTDPTDLNYINLPLMLQYEAFPSFRVEAGVEAGYLLKINKERSANGFKTRRLTGYTNWDVGINLGASYDFLERLNVGLRYNIGVYDIYDPQVKISYGDVRIPNYNVKNHTLQLTVGYIFSK